MKHSSAPGTNVPLLNSLESPISKLLLPEGWGWSSQSAEDLWLPKAGLLLGAGVGVQAGWQVGRQEADRLHPATTGTKTYRRFSTSGTRTPHHGTPVPCKLPSETIRACLTMETGTSPRHCQGRLRQHTQTCSEPLNQECGV